MNLYNLCIVGSNIQTLSFWKKDCIITTFLISIAELQPHQYYDYIFLSTQVNWDQDGGFDDTDLCRDIEIARDKGYQHELVITSTLPMGITETFGCHYFPIHQLHLQSTQNLLFGCYYKFFIDTFSIKNLLKILFNTDKIELRYSDETEIIVLISSCQNYINQSFQKEMSRFCSKNKIATPFPPRLHPLSQEFCLMTPILVYMIKKMEDIKLDCPILYSCLFRQNYIDIPI